ncbi:uncharacterized protein SEPMUDRAFT_116170 [Sphaerulina musiva SO2202]|uniref:Uncharacterized protein n=1 Tax=Sphaerulina musiva (strain SO2202) TaxID=692275 RepID=M3AZZ5_SPHMS|nr:uncharacterized protein SEPMUDRAFT_116170 [Sphaerulina musiva SO2202]EMF13107.1 hypothetical protein SEPMUDRAFT_116170 [Sphaerulina musiva SO2202]
MTARAAMTQAKLSHHASGVCCSPVLVPSGMSEEMPEGLLQDCKTAARLQDCCKTGREEKRNFGSVKIVGVVRTKIWQPTSQSGYGPAFRYSIRCVSSTLCVAVFARLLGRCPDYADLQPKPIFSEQDVALVSREKNADGVNNSLLCDAILKLGLDELLGFCRCDEHPYHADLDRLVPSTAIIRSGTAGR